MGRTFRRYLILFAVLAVIAGGVYWAWTDEADWWAYVEEGPPSDRWPKFKFHWPEQLVVVSAVGSMIAAPTTLAVFVARWVWSRRIRRYE
ncbi:MAG: hypothetical protein ABGY75_04510 [Gemmataceae bacterium]